jgi:hypothetical protein
MELSKVPQHYLRWLRTLEWVEPWLVRGIDVVLNGGSTGQAEPTGNALPKPKADDPHQSQSFSVRQSSKVIQAITNQDGSMLAWTTNEEMAQLICKLLNENGKPRKRKARPHEGNLPNQEVKA